VEVVTGFNALVPDHTPCGIRAITFAKDSHAKRIEGFNGCPLLQTIGIPASVEVVTGFNAVLTKEASDADFGEWVHGHQDCDLVFVSGLSQITFASGSRLHAVSGFNGCRVTRLDVPASVEQLSGFSGLACDYSYAVRRHRHWRYVYYRRRRPCHSSGDLKSSSDDECLDHESAVQSDLEEYSDAEEGTFSLVSQLEEVTFSEENQIRMIDGFERCSRLWRIENLPRCWKIAGRQTCVHHSPANMVKARRSVHVGLQGLDLHQFSSDDDESPDTYVQTLVATSDAKQRDGGSEEESMEANRMIDMLQRVFPDFNAEQVFQFMRNTYPDVVADQFGQTLSSAFEGTAVKYFAPDPDPLCGIIAYLTGPCGGNVHDRGVVIVSSSGSRDGHFSCAAKNAADLKDDSKFISSFLPRGVSIRAEGNN
jgi:hypothetical protein